MKLDEEFARLEKELGYTKDEVVRILARGCFARGAGLAINWLTTNHWCSYEEQVQIFDSHIVPMETHADWVGLDDTISLLTNCQEIDDKLMLQVIKARQALFSKLSDQPRAKEDL